MEKNRTLIYGLMLLIVVYACRTKKPGGSSTATHKDDTSRPEVIPVDTSTKTVYQIQVVPRNPIDTLKDSYEAAYRELENMLEGHAPLNFKRAVFTVENAYYNERLDYSAFEREIQRLVNLASAWAETNRGSSYRAADSVDFLKNYAIYMVMKDTIYLLNSKIQQYNLTMVGHYPFTYDFEDFFGKKDWSKMFVTKLITTQKGNCHSLPYLYKILANELGASAYISLAPSHFYIKNRSKQLGWYNTELTSGDFPTDGWITASGYISIDAIRSGIFMDTLSQKQSIGLCMFDLAKGYEKQRKNYADGFILKCCDMVLKYQPNNVSAIILKAETLKHLYETQMKIQKISAPSQLFTDSQSRKQYEEMQNLYVKALELGYREMPERMYIDWLMSVEAHKEKFRNPKINDTFKPKNKR